MAQAKNGDKVTIDYTGKLEDGTVFDSTLEDECSPDGCDSDDCGDDCDDDEFFCGKQEDPDQFEKSQFGRNAARHERGIKGRDHPALEALLDP